MAQDRTQDRAPDDDAETLQAASAEEELEAVRGELEGLRNELNQANDRYKRACAETDNLRKRTQRELADIRETTKASTIEEFLTVFDHFQMAVKHAETSQDFHTLKQGMDLILNEFDRAFGSLGVESIYAEGAPFDPAKHHAVAEEASDDVPEGHVVRQWKPGYRLGDRLIRPATVVVSGGPASAQRNEPSEPQTDASDSGTTE